jgi:phosphohistidine phosphatase
MGMAEAKRLLLLRHAKSSWDDPSLADHDRPLAPRGRKAAKLIRAHLGDQDIAVSLVLCSSARRARETLELVYPDADIRVEDELYGASADQLMARLRRLPEEAKAVMLVGHNPAIEELAVALSGDEELAERKFPTGALVTLSFRGCWRRLERSRAELTAFVTPKQLA